MDDYFGEKGIQKEETKHTQSYSAKTLYTHRPLPTLCMGYRPDLARPC